MGPNLESCALTRGNLCVWSGSNILRLSWTSSRSPDDTYSFTSPSSPVARALASSANGLVNRMLANPTNPDAEIETRDGQAAAQELGRTFLVVKASTEND